MTVTREQVLTALGDNATAGGEPAPAPAPAPAAAPAPSQPAAPATIDYDQLAAAVIRQTGVPATAPAAPPTPAPAPQPAPGGNTLADALRAMAGGTTLPTGVPGQAPVTTTPPAGGTYVSPGGVGGSPPDAFESNPARWTRDDIDRMKAEGTLRRHLDAARNRGRGASPFVPSRTPGRQV